MMMIKVYHKDFVFFFRNPHDVDRAFGPGKSLLFKVQLSLVAIDTRTNYILKCRYDIEELIEKGLSQYESK